MGGGSSRPWRQLEQPYFKEAEKMLKSSIGKITKEHLNIVMIGHVGAGKSSFINTVDSVFKNRIADKTTTKSDNVPGIGTSYFLQMARMGGHIIDNVHFFDTAGYSQDKEDDELGVQFDALKAVCEGRVPVNYRFNSDVELKEPSEKHRPHCVIFVISAELLTGDSIETNRVLQEKHDRLQKIIPHDVARIVVITKIDIVCEATANDIQQIYTSIGVYNLMQRVKGLFGVPENAVFPVVNFTKDVMVDPIKSVPILYALQRAIYFASDRQEDRVQCTASDLCYQE